MSRQSFHPHFDQHLPPLKASDEYFNQSKVINHALATANHTAGTLLTSIDLLQQENMLLRHEIERMRKIIGESPEADH